MTDHSAFQQGTKVIRQYNPGRRGSITGRSRMKGADVYYQVDFYDKVEYVPAYELEIVVEEHSNWEWLIEKSRFGRVSDLRRHLSHIQLSGKLSSIIYSLDITNSEFFPHQFKPVLSFLESPARGLLLADEVGLGKTIEAGLIWTELRARYDYRRVLIVCPAMLREKWRDELHSRFGVEATIINSPNDLLTELQRPKSRVPDGRGIICSIQGIRPPSTQQKKQNPTSSRNKLAEFLEEQSDNPPIVDLVIIDEAHYLRNPNSQSARLGKILRDISANILLLSATPINLKSDDLFSLLNIIDQDTFEDKEFFPQVLQANKPLVEARELVLDKNVEATTIRECLCEAAENSFLGENLQLRYILQKLESPDSVSTDAGRVNLADRIDRVNMLRHVVNRTRKSEVIEWRVVRNPVSKFVPFDEDGVEKNFYDAVTDAIKSYAEENGVNDGFLLASPQRQVSSCMYAAAKSWIDRAGRDEKDSYKEIVYEYAGREVDTTAEISPLMNHLKSAVLPMVDLHKLRSHDSKFNEFYEMINRYFSEYPEEKIVVFSYFRATLNYLKDRLAEQGVSSQVLMGGMRESKQEIINHFYTDDSIKVLLSSEVASEGVDLQFCRVIVNYDLPWNPMKIEQRIGRLDRIGQKADAILIWNLGYANTIDQRIYKRLFERLKIFEQALGGMEAILGEEIQKLTDDLISHRMTPRQEDDRITQTAIALENKRLMEKQLEKEASNLIAHSGYILHKVKKAYNLKKRITEEDLVIYVRDYLERHSPGHEFHQPDSEKLIFNIRLSVETAAELSKYMNKKNLYGHTKLETGDRVKCEFINKTSAARRAMEQISQFHPLIRFISKKINEDEFFPVVSAKLPGKKEHSELKLPAGHYAFAIQKWSFYGLHEEEDIRMRVTHLENDHALDSEDSWKLINSVRLGGLDWPESGTEVDSSELSEKVFHCIVFLDKQFQATSEIKKIENSDRINFQIRAAERNRDRHIRSLQNVLENYKARNEKRMIPATEGRIRSFNNRVDIQIKKLKISEKEPEKDLVCCGVLLIE